VGGTRSVVSGHRVLLKNAGSPTHTDRTPSIPAPRDWGPPNEKRRFRNAEIGKGARTICDSPWETFGNFPVSTFSKFPRFFWEGHALSCPGFARCSKTPDHHHARSACEIDPGPKGLGPSHGSSPSGDVLRQVLRCTPPGQNPRVVEAKGVQPTRCRGDLLHVLRPFASRAGIITLSRSLCRGSFT